MAVQIYPWFKTDLYYPLTGPSIVSYTNVSFLTRSVSQVLKNYVLYMLLHKERQENPDKFKKLQIKQKYCGEE